MKLTLVSVYAQGRKTYTFVHLPVKAGKTIAPPALINKLLAKLGVYQRGVTYTIGA